MKKLVAAAVVAAMVLGHVAVADVETTVDAMVTYNVKKVKVSQFMVMRQSTNLVVSAPYMWLDASNKVLRIGAYRATGAELSAMLGDSGPVVLGVLDRLTPTNGIQPMLTLNVANPTMITAMARTISGAGTNRVVDVTRYATNDIPAAIAPLTTENVIQLIQQMTQDILAE